MTKKREELQERALELEGEVARQGGEIVELSGEGSRLTKLLNVFQIEEKRRCFVASSPLFPL